MYYSRTYFVWALIGLLIPALVGFAIGGTLAGALSGFVFGGLLSTSQFIAAILAPVAIVLWFARRRASDAGVPLSRSRVRQ